MERLFDAFVRIVVFVLMVMMGIVVALAVVDLGWNLVVDLRAGLTALPAVAELFDVFGLFLMVLIGLELLESIRSYVSEHVLRVEVLLLAALMAIARKVIVLDLSQTSPLLLMGLAALVLALAGGYYLIRRQRGGAGGADDRPPLQTAKSDPERTGRGPRSKKER